MPAPVLQFKRGNAGVAGTVPALRPGEPAISLNNFDFFIGIDTSVANNKFFGSHRYWGREDGTTSLRLKLVDRDGTNYVSIKSPDILTGIVTYTLPGTQGSANSVLKNDGNGGLSWGSGIDFSGINTFTNTTDNTLGNTNTGAVQIDGGLGVDKNVSIGAGLSVAGESYFIGTATFYGGTINLGDSSTDIINIDGRIDSHLIPNIDATYDVGISTLNWRNAHFSGIGTFENGVVARGVQVGINGVNVIDTVSGNLTINSAGGQTIIDDAVTIQNNLVVNGNVTVGGTTVTLRGQDVFIENKDIVLGYTTSITPNDDSANHAGVAIASTVGTPLVNFDASGINTLPSTYKQLMWFKSGTLGFSTDAFAFNYGVAIGTTTMANGVRLAVGSGITMSDTAISATNFYGTFNGTISGNAASSDQVKTISAGDSAGTYYITFVNSHNGSATNETVYTDDGIYYNPGTNTFTTQHALFTGNVEIQGTLTGTATTATRATLIDTTNTTNNSDYYVTFVDTLAGQNSETLRVGIGLSVNPSTGNVGVSSILSVGNASQLNSYIKAGGGSNALYLYSNGDVSFQAKAIVNNIRSSSDSNDAITLSGRDSTFGNNILVSGIATVTGDLNVNGGDFNTTATTFNLINATATNVNFAGAATDIVIGADTGITTFRNSVRISDSLYDSSNSAGSSGQLLTVTGSGIGWTTINGISNGGISTAARSNTVDVSDTDAQTGNILFAASGNGVTVYNDTDLTYNSNTNTLTVPNIQSSAIKASDGTPAITISNTSGDVSISGNLLINGSTTQINTSELQVYDRTITLGIQTGTTPVTTTWDLGILMNYGDAGVAKTAGMIWDYATRRFRFGYDTDNPASSGTTTPQIGITSYAAVEVAELWINNSCVTDRVIGCSGGTLVLENITIDAGIF